MRRRRGEARGRAGGLPATKAGPGGAGNWRDRIAMDPRVMCGKPVIQGTRIPVDLIVRKMAEGSTEADLLDGYPNLTLGDVRAALAYAAASVALEEDLPIASSSRRVDA